MKDAHNVFAIYTYIYYEREFYLESTRAKTARRKNPVFDEDSSNSNIANR